MRPGSRAGGETPRRRNKVGNAGGTFARSPRGQAPTALLSLQHWWRRCAADRGPPFASGSRTFGIKEFRQKAGVLTIFVVDSSGSMALSRMDQAKGALIRLLQKAYVYRDRVALIGFRGDRADVLLPPSRSVELAKRALDSLAVGGGTPLAAGLQATLELATRQTDASQTLMVLLTDGRANVGGPDKLERACAALRTKRVGAVVIDNRDRFAAGGETERLAKLLGGRHVYLNRPGSDSVYSIVAEATEGLRGHGA